VSDSSTAAPRMTFGLAVVRALQKFTVLEGRASWAEFWWFALFQVLMWAALYASAAVVGASTADGKGTALGAIMLGVSLVLVVVVLSLIVPAVTLTVRRLHDTERSGWWAVLLPFPLLALIALLFCLLPGNASTNKYGEPSL
jgi:uncharacterized membrane protein YhaH (DUF805 family)